MLDAALKNALTNRPELVRRISFAPDLQTLWYVRSELMAAIAFERGEQCALIEIAAISHLFDDLLPEARSYKDAHRR